MYVFLRKSETKTDANQIPDHWSLSKRTIENTLLIYIYIYLTRKGSHGVSFQMFLSQLSFTAVGSESQISVDQVKF